MAVRQFAAGKAADPDGLDAETLQLLPVSALQWLCAALDLTLRTRCGPVGALNAIGRESMKLEI